MIIEEFRKHSHDLVDWMCKYFEEIEKYPIKPNIKPGSIYNSLPENPPLKGEKFNKIFSDFEKQIFPGMTHWQNPNFHAFFPANSSFPSILGEMLISTLGAQCMMWDTSPAATELEEKVTDWIRDAIGIPSSWKGVINDTASLGTISSLLTAREIKSNYDINENGFNNNKFKIYTSIEAHSSVEKAVKTIGIGSKNIRKIDTDNNLSMNHEHLEKEINNDIIKKNVPLAIISTFGTTGTVSFDPINKISEIANKYKIWHHIDAAYAGSVLFLEEYQKHIKKIHLADSFVFNPHKWMLTNFDCSLYYVKDKNKLIKTLEINPEYLKSSEKKINNYKDWNLQLGRRFRALKLWFVIKSYGIEGIKKYLRNHLKLAEYLFKKIEKNEDFEITCMKNINMINFRLNPTLLNFNNKSLNILNKKLLNNLNKTGKIYISHTVINGIYSIRMPIASTTIQKNHIDKSWSLIKKMSKDIIKEQANVI